MRSFIQAALFLLLDLASTLVFAGVVFLTGNTVLAVGVGIAIGVLQIATQIARGRTVEAMEWLSIALVVTAGAATLLTDDPRFLLFKPSVIYAVVGAVMLKRGWLLRYLPEPARRVAPDVATAVGYGWAGLMFLSAVVNAVVAIAWGVSTWALVMPAFGIVSKALVFVAGFAAIRLTTMKRVRAMTPADRQAMMAGAR
jgi:intracellular septation protein